MGVADPLNNDVAATSILDDFIAIVEAKRGRQVSYELAEELVGLAEEVIASLQST